MFCLTVWKNLLCSGPDDSTIRLWNSEWNCVRILRECSNDLGYLTVWNNLLFLGDYEGTITVWKWTEKNHIAILKEHGSLIQMTVWKNTLYCGCDKGVIKRLDLTPLLSVLATQSKIQKRDTTTVVQSEEESVEVI